MKKKGFTLIELLAVILILAIIAVIVTPIISKIIDEAKAQSDKRSAEKYVRAAQTFYMESQMDESKRAVLGTNIIDRLDLENIRSTGTVVAYPDGTVEMAIIIGSRCFTKTTTQDIIDIQMSKDTENCYVLSSSAYIDSINSGDNSIEISINNSADTSVTLISCKYGTEAGKYDTDGTINGNICTLSPTEVGVRYYYELTFSDGSKKFGSIQGGSGIISPTPSNGGGSSSGGGYHGGGDHGGGAGAAGGGSSGTGGVAAPILTEANGRTVYTGRMVSPVRIKYFNVTTGTACDIVDFSANGGSTTNGMNSGCLKFWVYMEDDLSYTMILDRSLSNIPYQWASSGSNASGPVTAYAALKELTANWQGTITPKNYINVYMVGGTEAAYRIAYDTDGAHARFITTDEIARITGNTSFSSVSSGKGDWFYLDGGTAAANGGTWQTQMATSTQQSAYYWLYNYTYYNRAFLPSYSYWPCTSLGCANGNENNISGYWTADAIASTNDRAWTVGARGAVEYGPVNETGLYNSTSGVNDDFEYGIRPVITVLKSALD